MQFDLSPSCACSGQTRGVKIRLDGRDVQICCRLEQEDVVQTVVSVGATRQLW